MGEEGASSSEPAPAGLVTTDPQSFVQQNRRKYIDTNLSAPVLSSSSLSLLYGYCMVHTRFPTWPSRTCTPLEMFGMRGSWLRDQGFQLEQPTSVSKESLTISGQSWVLKGLFYGPSNERDRINQAGMSYHPTLPHHTLHTQTLNTHTHTPF